MEVLAEMVTKAPTRVAIVEPCLGEPKDFEVLFLWKRILMENSRCTRRFTRMWFKLVRGHLEVFTLCETERQATVQQRNISVRWFSSFAKLEIFDLILNYDQEKSKVRREAEVLRSLIQSAFVVQLVGLFESPLNSVLVTEYLAGGDLITR